MNHATETQDRLRALYGYVTTGVISFVLLAINPGFSQGSVFAWARV